MNIEKEVVEKNREEEISLKVAVPETSNEVIPINIEAALANYTEAEQREILALADRIDVRETEKIMNYGSKPLQTAFEQTGEFLKRERGSQADQIVMEKIRELSKKTNESYEEFKQLLKEPNFLQKTLLKIASNKNNSRAAKMQKKAITSYDLLIELKKSCDSWLELLRDAMGEIEEAALSDIQATEMIEKYIISGKLSQKRIENDLEDANLKYKETGLQRYSYDYKKIKEGYDLFFLKVNNLEKSCITNNLSIAELSVIAETNKKLQLSIHEKLDHSMLLFGQQLRNALLNAKNREVLEGQNSILKLSDELITNVAQMVGLTAKEAETALYSGFFNTDVVEGAFTIMIDTCKEVQEIANEMIPKIQEETARLKERVKDLEPYVEMASKSISKEETLKIEAKPSTEGIGKLKF